MSERNKAYQTADLLANGKGKIAKRKSSEMIAESINASNAEQENIPQLKEEQETILYPEANVEDSSTKRKEGESRNHQEAQNEDANHWNTRGNQYLQSGSYDDAIKAYKKAIELSPSSVWAYLDNLALAFYRKGQRGEQATQSAQKLSEVWGDNNSFEFIDNHAENSQTPNQGNSTVERPDLMLDDTQIMIRESVG